MRYKERIDRYLAHYLDLKPDRALHAQGKVVLIKPSCTRLIAQAVIDSKVT